MVTKNKDWKTMLGELEGKLAEVFAKAPALPENVKEIIVKYGPYLALIGIIFSVPTLLALFGVGAAIAPWAIIGGVSYGIKTILTMAFAILMIVLEIIALPGLFKREMRSWKIMFYISLINVVSNLISFNLFSLVVGAAICWYFLFQIKSYYK